MASQGSLLPASGLSGFFFQQMYIILHMDLNIQFYGTKKALSISIIVVWISLAHQSLNGWHQHAHVYEYHGRHRCRYLCRCSQELLSLVHMIHTFLHQSSIYTRESTRRNRYRNINASLGTHHIPVYFFLPHLRLVTFTIFNLWSQTVIVWKNSGAVYM